MAKKKQQLNTQQVIERLAAHYPSPVYGFLTQVRSCTGYGNPRTADAMAMSLWPSRGLHLYGFEVKASRSDWLSELKRPDKAEEIAAYCHHWYMVFGSEEIFEESEVPAKWGIIIPKGRGLTVMRKATHREKTAPIDDNMLAGIFRNVSEHCIPKEVLKTKFDERFEAGKESGGRMEEQRKRDHKELCDTVRAFEQSSGVDLNRYDIINIGAAVKEVLEGRDKEGAKRLASLHQKIKNLLKYVEGEDIPNYESQ